ncbi:MAG: UDP-glucose 4-epimerase [Sphingomonadaceae bacterium]|nr:UDP-glucose 4-epimerase [Sphingomonadaceae bacterium]
MPCNHYGHSKMMCEHVLKAISVYGTIDVTTFRYFNVAGGYKDVGQDEGEPHLITRLSVAARSGNPMVVFGSDYPTRDGTCVRDYLHVRDVCRAQIHAMDHKITGTFNLGTEHGLSVKEVIQAFEATNKIKVPHSFGQRRKGDPSTLVASPAMFINRYGFNYQHSSIEEIVQSAWEYYCGV